MPMTNQAKTVIRNSYGANVATVAALVQAQRPAVVRELQNIFGTRDEAKLAQALSQGKPVA